MKIGYVHIKTLRNPVQVTEESGREVERLLSDDSVNPESVVRIGNGVWTGRKEDLRFVTYEEVAGGGESEDNKGFSKDELNGFESELEPYLVQKDGDVYNELVERIASEIINNERVLHVKPLFDEIQSLQQRGLSEGEARDEARRLVNEYHVGTLTKEGELRFLEDKDAIVRTDGDYFRVKKSSEHGIPYARLSKKIEAWRDFKRRRDYGMAQAYEQMAQTSEAMNVREDF